MSLFDDAFKNIKDTVDYGLRLISDEEIRLGVTGLSRGGKSAFITSLVNLVSKFGDSEVSPYLSRFKAYTRGDIIYGGIARPRDLSIGSFPYNEAISSLYGEPAVWPKATDNVSEIRLALKVKNKSWYSSKPYDLYLDIWDYPGEWLMDLMLLEKNYEEFSNTVKEHLNRIGTVASAKNWIEAVNQLDPDAPLNEIALSKAVSLYKEWLINCKQQGFAFIVPGRFVLPGNLLGAPILEFIPWLGKEVQNPNSNNTLYAELRARYEAYRKQVVQKFYEDCFSKLDRQIVLIDCLRALKGGRENFFDVNATLDILMNNFNYGSSNFLTRLFAPKIDKVMFAATKADLVTNDNHQNLRMLLTSLVNQAQSRVLGEGGHTEFAVISSIRATQCKHLKNKNFDGQVLLTDYEDDGAFFPGTVPQRWSPENMEFFSETVLFKGC